MICVRGLQQSRGMRLVGPRLSYFLSLSGWRILFRSTFHLHSGFSISSGSLR